MNKEINYPIKYAVLELKERGGWYVNYEDVTQGFIASKCYVVESNVVYHSNGTSTINHNVVFPYEDISSFKVLFRNGKKNIGNKNKPHYDAYDRPYPVNIVSKLFDTYEQAKEEAISKNEEHRRYLINKVPITKGDILNQKWNTNYEILTREFDERLKICNVFEQLVLEATEDMDVTVDKSKIKVLKPTRKKENNNRI